MNSWQNEGADGPSGTMSGTTVIFVQGVLLVLLWWATAVAVTVVIKQTLGGGESANAPAFPFPFALTGLTNGCVGAMAFFLSSIIAAHTNCVKGALHASVNAEDHCGQEAQHPHGGPANETRATLSPSAHPSLLERPDLERQTRPVMRMNEVLRLVSIGVIQGAEIGCNNKSLEFLTVSARTMINSTSVLFMMATAYLWGLEGLGMWRLLSAFCLCLGAVLQGLPTQGGGASGEPLRFDFDIQGALAESRAMYIGVTIQVVAMIIGSVRWALVQIVLQRSPRNSALGQLSKLELTSRVMPVTGVVCCMLACIFEAGALSPDELFRTELMVQVVTIASLVSVLTLAELSLVRLTSAVAVAVLCALHQIPLVLAGVIFFGDDVNPFGISGFALCVVGAIFYAIASASGKAGTTTQTIAPKPLPLAEAAAATACASPEE